MNLYSYVNGMPTSLINPLGLMGDPDGWAFENTLVGRAFGVDGTSQGFIKDSIYVAGEAALGLGRQPARAGESAWNLGQEIAATTAAITPGVPDALREAGQQESGTLNAARMLAEDPGRFAADTGTAVRDGFNDWGQRVLDGDLTTIGDGIFDFGTALLPGTQVTKLGSATQKCRGFVRRPHNVPLDTIAANKRLSLSPWPESDGFFLGFRKQITLEPGTVVDRFGLERGRFTSPEGTPLEARALRPYGNETYNAYQVNRPIGVQAGLTAPAFGKPVLGIQYMLADSVSNLIDSEHLSRRAP